MDSDNQREQLAALEDDLRRDDPALARRFALFAASSPRPPSWAALFTTAGLLVAAGLLLAASVHWSSPVLLVAAIVVFCLAGLPTGRSGRRRPPHGSADADQGARS